MVGSPEIWRKIGAKLYHYGRVVYGKVIRLHLSDLFVRRSVTIALASRPRLLREMLCQLIDDQPGLQVVVATGDPTKLLQTLNNGWVDWVVTMADLLPLQASTSANFRYRGPGLIVLSRDTRTAEVTIPGVNGQPLRQVFSNLTLDQFFAILRRHTKAIDPTV